MQALWAAEKDEENIDKTMTRSDVDCWQDMSIRQYLDREDCQSASG